MSTGQFCEERRVLQEPKPIRMTRIEIALVNKIKRIPKNYNEARTGPEKEKWMQAIEIELKALMDLNTWQEGELPTGRKEIDMKWVFAIKDDGRYKARLVVRGFKQLYGIDFEDTFAPTAAQAVIRICMAIAAYKKWKCNHYDISNAFMNGILGQEHEVWIKLPDGYISPNGYRYAKLLRALNGLKQGGRVWYHTVDGNIKSIGFIQSIKDNCLYYYKEGQETVALLVMIVDDFLLITNSDLVKGKLEDMLDKSFKHRKIGIPNKFNGVEINYGPNGEIFTHQKNYIQEKVMEFNIQDFTKAIVPVTDKMDKSLDAPCIKLDKEMNYQGIIGSMLYTYTATRPDISYAICRSARFSHKYGLQHWNMAIRLCQYLDNTKQLGLLFKGQNLVMDAFVDASYASPRSITGYIVRIGGTAVIWRSKLQSIASQSTMEAEYVALSEVVKEIMFIRQLMDEIGFGFNIPTRIYEDNEACIQLSKNPVFRDKAKHIEVRYHLIRDELTKGTVELNYIDTKNQIADGLTKPISNDKLQEMATKMNLCKLPKEWLQSGGVLK